MHNHGQRLHVRRAGVGGPLFVSRVGAQCVARVRAPCLRRVEAPFLNRVGAPGWGLRL